MTISKPRPRDLASLRSLWKTAFGDTDEFLDLFYSRAYAPERCRCVLDGDRVAAALHWFDCTCEGRKLAYIYAVATDPVYRNQGLCRRLMADTHAHLKAQGYAAAMLLPQDPGLRIMYGTMGYSPCTEIQEFSCEAAGEGVSLKELTAEGYAERRKALLPPGSVLQEGENLRFLGGFARFLEGPGFLTAVFQEEGHVLAYELLGNPDRAPAILQALNVPNGTFRCPGRGKDFAMWTPFDPNCPKPRHFAFAFD